MKYLLLLTLSAATFLVAKDFGKTGTTFPVEEENLLDSLKSKAALHAPKFKQYAEAVQKQIQHPPLIDGIGKAIEKRSWLYDPTHTVEADILLDGERLVKAGTKINPLENIELPGGMLFFDGDDPAQIAWARKESPDCIWVLVNGSPDSLEEREKRAVYYDQLGIFTSRFQIKNVPAKVVQEGSFLRIEEIPDEEAS
ncbi:MAG TPA: hypothetical protein VLE95_06595 [Chlamydiales bacterium]|nr:hypothetical protein [Chlamydiales bacterium]